MSKIIIELFSLLSSGQRMRFFILQILVILMAIFEILSVASIIPFMSLVGDAGQLQQDTIISQVYQISGITSEKNFLYLLGFGVLVMLFISAIVSMLTIWRLSMFGNKVGCEIGDRLYAYYLRQDLLFHTSGSSSQFTRKIAIETQRITKGIILPLMQLN